MLVLRLGTLKSLTKIGRLISATSSARTLVNFETKASRSAFGASVMNFCARVNTVRKRFAASALALSQLSLANIAGLLQYGEERLHRPHRIQPVLRQRIGHLRERNFRELHGLRVAAVPPHP